MIERKNRFIKVYNIEEESTRYINIDNVQVICICVWDQMYSIKIKLTTGSYSFGEYQDFCRANNVMERLIRAINNEEEHFKYPVK